MAGSQPDKKVSTKVRVTYTQTIFTRAPKNHKKVISHHQDSQPKSREEPLWGTINDGFYLME